MLIYQVDNGSSNANTAPKGGVISQGSDASSMLTTIANPITYYGSGAVINQAGHSKDLYNYYWTSYSRGTDGRRNNITSEPSWHNDYLDGYIPLRVKSIYDPCPYSYRIPSNGTWNQFNMQSGWTTNSYLGGAGWNMNTLGVSWFLCSGWRAGISSVFNQTGAWAVYCSSIVTNNDVVYLHVFNAQQYIYENHTHYSRSNCFSVRCIED